VALAARALLFEGELHLNLRTAQVLPVHGGDR
jgi:hypothetical protein